MGRRAVNITADTNVLLRALINDDAAQGERARQSLRTASSVAVTDAALCEMVWVLMRGYDYPRQQVIEAIERLAGSTNVVVNGHAVATGLDFMRHGADFADGVIAAQGSQGAASVFTSFDVKAIAAAHRAGYTAAAPLGGATESFPNRSGSEKALAG